MATLRIYPHRTASPDHADVQWWLERDGQRFSCPDVLPGWDYDSPLTIGMTLSIDGDEVLASTGLTQLEALAGVLQIECRSAQVRFMDRASFGGSDGNRIEIRRTVPAGSVANSLTFRAHVVLGENRELHAAAPRVAARKGARLISLPPHTVVIEGDAGRFPTEAVSFTALGLKDAPWTISLTHEDMGDSFMGAVRLLLNSDHPVTKQILVGEDHDRFSDAMTADLIRLLVAGLRNELVAPGHLESEDSLASVMDSMCGTYLNCSFEEARSLFAGDPIAFDALVQQKINPLGRFLQ